MDRLMEIWIRIQKCNVKNGDTRKVSWLNDCRKALENRWNENSGEESAKGNVCPHCGNTQRIRYGKTAAGEQRYRCRACGRTYLASGSTPWGRSRKDQAVWKRYAECLLRGSTLRNSAKECGISVPTAFQWRHIILGILADWEERFSRTTAGMRRRVGAYSQRIREFLGEMRGVSERYLQNYLAWYDILRQTDLGGEQRRSLLSLVIGLEQNSECSL